VPLKAGRLRGRRRGARDSRPVAVALAAGLALSAIAVALTLAGAPSVVAGTNGAGLELRFADTEGPGRICQPDETLPRETSAIRLSLEATVGPRVTLEAFAGGRLVTGGTRDSGWTAGSVTIPVRPLPRQVSGVTLCLTIARSRVHVSAFGAQAGPASAARGSAGAALKGRLRSEYLRAGHTSWWSLGLAVARRMGLGRTLSGTWIALAVALAMLAVALLATQLVLRETTGGDTLSDAPRGGPAGRWSPRRIAPGVPAAAWTCAAVACLNAVCWSLITPPFQVPDESSHFAYAELLAERGRLPVSTRRASSAALQLTLDDLHSLEIRFNPPRRSLASEAQQRQLERDQAAPYSRKGPGGAGAATSEPPLYYALETIPYELASSGSLLDQLEAMRVLSAVMAAITALFGYLFLREALPGSRWAWAIGGLAVALFPLLGFISGGVNPDALLFAVCAACYYCLARAFRRGLTLPLSIAIGALTAAGLLTKLNFVGFAPGVVLGLVLIAMRARRGGSSQQPQGALGLLSIAVSIAASPALLYALANLVSNRPALGAVSGALDGLSSHWAHELSYVWQFYLPRLPGMPDYFPSVSTWRQLWFDGLVGLYGWADTLFPGWVYDVALVPGALIAALCVRELVLRRAALRARVPELIVYVAMGAGVMAVVGLQSYASDVRRGFEPFWEPRYLLPMLVLWGAIVALAARGAGRRWGPVVGALLVVLLLFHDVVSQLQVIARYYG
jgi:hypothetical protein